MSDLLVIYDPDVQVGAIVDIDTRMGYGPTMAGPHAKQLLQTFIDTLPFDIDGMSTYDRARAFTSFLERAGMAADTQAGTPGTGVVEPGGHQDVAGEAKAAEAEATHAGDVPAPQPADTDTPPPPSAETKQVTCGNCNGTGTTPDGPNGEAVQCRMCQGTGRVTVPVA